MRPEELKKNLESVFFIMRTPFKPNFEVDYEGMRKNARFLIDSGAVTGKGVLVVTGSGGQCYALKNEERTKIAEAVVDEANGEVPVVAGCNHTSTLEAAELATNAQSVGADGIMLAPPFYHAPSREQTLMHYNAVADAIDIGIVIYNLDRIGASPDIPVEWLVELANNPKIVGIKDCTWIHRKRVRTAMLLKGKITVMNGSGEYFEPYSYMMGTRGYISTIGIYLPKQSLSLFEALLRKDFDTAKDINHKFFSPIYFGDYGRVNASAAMKLLGLVAGTQRPPAFPVTAKQIEETKKVLTKIGVL